MRRRNCRVPHLLLSTVIGALTACSRGAVHPVPTPEDSEDGTGSSSAPLEEEVSPKEPSPALRAAPPNVVLLVMDTVRADHTSAYGYERETTPAIERLAEHATLYERAMSTAPWTLPTHASLFTGLYPFEHGVRTYPPREDGKENVHPLGLDHLTLAEVLGAEGYHTGAWVANTAYLYTIYNLNQGFDTWHIEGLVAPEMNRLALQLLDGAGNEPFFLFINYIDAHRVYNTTPRPGFLDPPAIQDGAKSLDALFDEVMPGEVDASPELVRKVVDQYDTALANLDEAIGGLMDELRARGLWDDTLVVVTSDHGEYFGEHRLVEHSKDIYQEAVWVPLIVKAPGQRHGRRVSGLTSSADVPNLVLSALPEERFGKYLESFPSRGGARPVVAENYYTRPKDLHDEVWGKRFQRVRKAVFEWPYKYIASSDDADELYDLEADPTESNNLVDELPEVTERLRAELKRTVEHARGPGGSLASVPIDEELEENLRALGYVDDE